MRGVGWLILLMGCQSGGSRAVVEVYKHPNGLTNCVENEKGGWKADPSCCPDGFEMVGFSAPSATAYAKPDEAGEMKEVRRIFRHVVCLERKPGPQ